MAARRGFEYSEDALPLSDGQGESRFKMPKWVRAKARGASARMDGYRDHWAKDQESQALCNFAAAVFALLAGLMLISYLTNESDPTLFLGGHYRIITDSLWSWATMHPHDIHDYS